MKEPNRSVAFFEAQFAQQARKGEFALNPFEALALPFARGRALDLGCGLGNLALAAARSGCTVLALDGSASAIARIRADAASESLAVEALEADLGAYRITESFDTIVAIGLLMFFARPRALELLEDIKAHVRPGGRAIVNVLVEGTTYLDMFDPAGYCLFGKTELEERFAGWEVLESKHHDFDAPGGTVKSFATLIVQRP